MEVFTDKKATQSFEEIMDHQTQTKRWDFAKGKKYSTAPNISQMIVLRDLKKEWELQSSEQFYKIEEDAVPTKFVHANNSTPRESSNAIQDDSTFSADDDNSDLSDHDAGEYDNDYCPEPDANVSSTESVAHFYDTVLRAVKQVECDV